MKRWTAIIVLLLLMILTACGSSTENQVDHSVQEDPFCVLTISINPQFALHLDDAFLITQIQYLNDDAQNAFGDVDVIGLALFDGLFALLDRAHGEGYLQDGAQMEVSAEVHGEQGFAEHVEEEIQVAVNDLKDKRQVTVAFNYTVDIKEGESFVANSQESGPMDLVDEVDGTGAADEMVGTTDDNGNVIHSEDHRSDENLVMDPAGTTNADGTTELTFVDNEGRHVTQRINANGVIIYQRLEHPDRVKTMIFDENGILREEKNEFENGDWRVCSFDTNGYMIREEEHRSNGYYHIIQWAPDGTEVSREVFDPVVNDKWENPFDYIEKTTEVDSNGIEVTTWHDGRGRLLAEEGSWQDGRTYRTEYEYDDADQQTRSMRTFSDGSTEETIYENGHRHIITSYDTGSGYRQVSTYNEDDVLISHISDGPDGEYSYRYYDDNGVLVKWDLLDFFGRDSKRTYNPDGSYIDRVYEPEIGKTLVIGYDANGNEISYAEE